MNNIWGESFSVRIEAKAECMVTYARSANIEGANNG